MSSEQQPLAASPDTVEYLRTLVADYLRPQTNASRAIIAAQVVGVVKALLERRDHEPDRA